MHVAIKWILGYLILFIIKNKEVRQTKLKIQTSKYNLSVTKVVASN